ncbi:DEAD-domain-containing protein [Dacryopinax primogenitus]|uniref:ATP-dependent rRNA helicase RRP3 n=1 Tax=Dacryopinax primogenitus (strain DJM 731) TaxID=1858805 RepID=M5FRM7_DACPD|nr:DEAD-domain-containing protein [Dacryopinax primogenitus]EJT98373.1 DEAD-domain-containing protein [Dacryopinax primogenitus]
MSSSEASSSRAPSPVTSQNGTADAQADSATIAPVADPNVTFSSLGLIEPLVDACKQLNFKRPTPIQAAAIPPALEGKDIIGLAETGSGKTAAFALPILQKLWHDPKPFFCVVLAPTRELAYQISQQFEALGSTIGVRCAVLIGGVKMVPQAVALSKRPHIVVATPGRLQDHLENTKGFSLRGLKYLVMDEADRLLDLDFGPIIDTLLKAIPRQRNTMLFSATMTTKVAKLQRTSLRNPVKVEVSSKYQTVSTLLQTYVLTPAAVKEPQLVHLLTTVSGLSTIVFVRTIHDATKLTLALRNLGFPAIPLHGDISQDKRLGAISRFKAEPGAILVATDVASRGLDMPKVDAVINYDLPTNSKDYIHRVGRTARAGRAGKAISIVTQYDVELLQRIEHVIGKKLEAYGETTREEVEMLRERVGEAVRAATIQMKEQEGKRTQGGRGRKRQREGKREQLDRDDDEVEAGMPRLKKARARR